ncbi:MAG TPA: hypothetical protein VF331_04860 [Polyangiales bacterium]
MTRAAKLRRTPRSEFVIGLLVFASCAYFHGGAASNQNARLDAIFSFVEPGTAFTGTFRIDRFLPLPERDINTNDWAHYGGHYYANKAPGSIVLGAAVYTAVHYTQSLFGTDARNARTAIVDSYLINLALGAACLAVAALLFFRMLRPEVSERRAAALTLGLFLGTGLFPYATQLWGHPTAAAFVVFAMYELRKATPRGAAWGGFWLAASVATDYLALLAAVGLALGYLVHSPRHVLRVAVGTLGPVLALLAYHWLCFGSPWTLATTYSNPAYLRPERALGMFAGPQYSVWLELLLGTYRGVLAQMPVMLLCCVGFVHWWRRSPRDPWLWSCLLTSLAASLTVAGFNGWHGGSTVCARYLLPFVPIAFFAAKELPSTRTGSALALLLGGLSVCNMLAVAAVSPLCPDKDRNPLYGYTYDLFFQGKLAPYDLSIRLLRYGPHWSAVRGFTTWNLGELLGLTGLWTLLPLLVLWLAAAVVLVRAEPAEVAS